MKALLFVVALLVALPATSAGAADAKLDTHKLAEKKVATLPPGPLAWWAKPSQNFSFSSFFSRRFRISA